ncbi:MAG: hypothetical protein HDR00_15020 [Lachnospiraceae bacterium]|nr:hypothetical protein [Lachnospiraceae bacterium]
MKYLYRISLTFMILTILSAALLSGYYFYQQHNESKRKTSEEKVEETAVTNDQIDCDTEYVILEQDLNTGESESLVEEIPSKYIGRTKEQLISILEQEERSPSLRDRQKGIVSIRLSAFSNERVVVVKTYEIKENGTEEEETGESGTETEEVEETMQSDMETIGTENAEGVYYLMANGGVVYVYQGDMKTLYLATDITIDQLPDDVRQEILDKKYIKNEEELYNFLESYSS